MGQPHDFPFDITDVAELLHLRIRRPSPQGFYVDCPICNDKRGKMHINTQTDTWRCNYCGESGGMLALYEERGEHQRSDRIPVGGGAPCRYFDRQRDHLYLARRGDPGRRSRSHLL